MSTNKVATTDKSRQLTIKARVFEAGVPLTLTFLNSDGTPHSITDYDFSLPVKRSPSATVNLFELTIGDGLEVIGADTNKLKITLSEARSRQKPDTYFYKIYSNDEGHTWLNGPFVFHDGLFDGIEETEDIVISANGADITIEVNIGTNGSELWGGPWTFADNADAFPESTASGQQFFTLDEHGSPGDSDYVPQFTLLIATAVGANTYNGYYKK